MKAKITSEHYKIACVNLLCSELNKEVANVEIIPGVYWPKCEKCGSQLFIIFDKEKHDKYIE